MVSISLLLDILSYLVGVTGLAPLFVYLHPFSRVAVVAALVGGIWCDRRGTVLKSGWMTASSVILFAAYAAVFGTRDLVAVSVNLLALFLGIRLLGEKSGRNRMQICALSVFCLAASTLYSLNALFTLYLLVLFLLIAVELVFLAFDGADAPSAVSMGDAKKIAGTALLMPLFSLPLILLFFLVLPRTQVPLWQFSRTPAPQVGYTDSVAPGRAAALGSSRAPAFRVVSPRLDPSGLYWRGTVLNTFTGGVWRRDEPPREKLRPAGGSASIRQTVFLEPGFGKTVFALEHPESVSGVPHSVAADGTLLRRGSASRTSYTVTSAPASSRGVSGVDRAYYLRITEGGGRMEEVASRAASGASGAGEVITRLERFYRSRNLMYARTGLPVGEDAVENFLFRERRGNCEFFASSLALLLRRAGVPSRLVGGYFGGEYNEAGGYYLVTQDMAHVWVEALVDGDRWVRIDPTEWGTNVDPGGERGFLNRARLYLDTIDYYWTAAVVVYDIESQLNIVRRAGSTLKSPLSPGALKKMLPVLPMLMLAGGCCLFLRRRSVDQRLLGEFRKILFTYSPASAHPSCGLRESAVSTANADAIRSADILGGALYRDRKLTAEERAELKELLRRLRNEGPGA